MAIGLKQGVKINSKSIFKLSIAALTVGASLSALGQSNPLGLGTRAAGDDGTDGQGGVSMGITSKALAMTNVFTIAVGVLICILVSCTTKAQTPLEAIGATEKTSSVKLSLYKFRGDGYIINYDRIILAKRDTKICAIKFDSTETTKLGKSTKKGVYREAVAWQRYDLEGNKY